MDLIFGGKGDDFMSSIGDDGKDSVDCGPGIDSVDQSLGTEPTPKDVYRDCERVVA